MSQPRHCCKCKMPNPTFRGDKPGHFVFMPEDWREIVFKHRKVGDTTVTVYVCPTCFNNTLMEFV